MTDPFSIFVGSVALFKEAWLIANFIYRTANSVKISQEERRTVMTDMQWELNMLRSFGRYFTQGNGVIMNDAEVDGVRISYMQLSQGLMSLMCQFLQIWLNMIEDVLQGMLQDFSVYTTIARTEDLDYRKFLNNSGESAAIDDVDIDRDIPKPAESSTESSFFSKLPQLLQGRKTRLREAASATRWALWDKRRLEVVVVAFRSRNMMLKDVLQMADASLAQRAASANQWGDPPADVDARRLGITAHAEIRKIVAASSDNGDDYDLEGTILDPIAEANSLRVGTYQSVKRGNSTSEAVLVEYKSYPRLLGGLTEYEIQEVRSALQSRVHKLASLLASSGDNDLGTLPFKGLLHQPELSRHAFVFHFPSDTLTSEAVSLHSVIATQAPGNAWPLESRFAVAQSLARSIAKLHIDGWIHKSIRSHAVVFFKNRTDSNLLVNSPYLVDFEYSRPESGSTVRLHLSDPERNLYRHPDLQDVDPSSSSMVHDIYSLGVVLLEIALWQTVGDIYKRTKKELNASGLQKLYLDGTRKKVGHTMGSSYQSVVLACLDSKYKDQTRRRDFPRIFHEEVLQKLTTKAAL